MHQHASGASLRQTKANGELMYSYSGYRTAEYDALGNNVGDSNPYIVLNTQPPDENPGGITLGGGSPYEGGSGNPVNSRVYLVDGQRVSESYFMMEVNSGRIGGAFGLLKPILQTRLFALLH